MKKPTVPVPRAMPPPLSKNERLSLQHVIREEREQPWTFKQAFLRRARWPDAVMTLGFLAFVACIVVCGTYFLSRPVTVTADCSASDWRLLPQNLTWLDGVRVAPSAAHCSVAASGPLASLALAEVDSWSPPTPAVQYVDRPVPLFDYGAFGHRVVVLDQQPKSFGHAGNVTLMLELNYSNQIVTGVETYQCSPNVKTYYDLKTVDGINGFFYAEVLSAHGVCILQGEQLAIDGRSWSG